MNNLFLAFFLLIFLYGCSVDTKSGIWENKIDLKTSISKKISDIKFNEEMSFKQFKENAIQYGKLSDFPKLD